MLAPPTFYDINLSPAVSGAFLEADFSPSTRSGLPPHQTSVISIGPSFTYSHHLLKIILPVNGVTIEGKRKTNPELNLIS